MTQLKQFGYTYTQTHVHPPKVERSLKSAAYVEYVKDLAAYLVAFFERSQPLVSGVDSGPDPDPDPAADPDPDFSVTQPQP